MPIFISQKSYAWLQKIGIFHQEATKSQSSPDLCQIPYDEQIYLQNGYLIGVALRKFVKTYSQQYQELLKVRKLATLQSSQNQNWQIIQPYLSRIGCTAIAGHAEDNSYVQISTAQIAQILEALYDQYGPKQQQKSKNQKKLKSNFIDIYNFNPNKQPRQCQSSLQLFCNILVRTLKINLNEALGLLICKSKYLKKLIIQGSKIDQFESVKRFYQEIVSLWPVIEQFTVKNQSDIEKILQAPSQGIFSQNLQIIHLTLNLFSLIKSEQWLIKTGYYKLLCSNYIQCFYFTLQKLSPNYDKILNTNLHTKLQNKMLLFTLLHNLIKTLPKTIYSKQIFMYLPLSYFYQQCYTVLNVDDIDDQPPKLVTRALQLLTKLIITHPEKIPHSYLTRITQTFRYEANRGYCNSYHILALLFQIIQTLISKQSMFIETFFKICMRYLNCTFGQTRHWIIQNLKYLYERMNKSFPLGYLLVMYSLDSIGQADQYQLFDKIANDNTQITQQQSTLVLSYISKYIQTQIHCRCFIDILRKFMKNHNRILAKWAEEQCVNLVNKMHGINIPMLVQGEINILNPKPPVRNRVVNSIGIKRKQMLKFRQYELYKELLEQLINVPDKKYLLHYLSLLNHAINNLEKQLGMKKRELLNLFKKLRNKVKKQFQITKQPETIDQLVKSIIVERSSISRTAPLDNMYGSILSQSQMMDNQSQIKTGRIRNYEQQTPVLQQQHQQDDKQSQNQFIAPNKIDNNNKYDSLSNTQENQIDPLKQFSQEQPWQEQEDLIIISNDMLEQNQIAYVDANRQKYQRLLDYCQGVYESYQKNISSSGSNRYNDKDMGNLLSSLALQNLIQSKKFSQILQKLKNVNKSKTIQTQVKVQQILTQVAFHVFNFKKNRRVGVTCVSSLCAMMDQKLREDNLDYRTMISTQTTHNGNRQIKTSTKSVQLSITKNILYQNKLSGVLARTTQNTPTTNKKPKNNKHINYYQCFQILSQIFEKQFGISLLQPMSKQINNFGPPASVSTAGELDLNITVTNNNSINRSMLKGKYRSDTNIQDSEELQYLEEQLEILEDGKLEYEKNRYNRYKKLPVKTKFRVSNNNLSIITNNNGNGNTNNVNSNPNIQQNKQNPTATPANMINIQKIKKQGKDKRVQQLTHLLTDKSAQQHKQSSPNFVDNKQLKNKISRRIQQLSQQTKPKDKDKHNSRDIENDQPKEDPANNHNQITQNMNNIPTSISMDLKTQTN